MTDPWVTIYLVTVKLPKNSEHDPKNKKVGGCVSSATCTDATGEHHTIAVRTQGEVEEIRDAFGHITRIEKVAIGAWNLPEKEGE